MSKESESKKTEFIEIDGEQVEVIHSAQRTKLFTVAVKVEDKVFAWSLGTAGDAGEEYFSAAARYEEWTQSEEFAQGRTAEEKYHELLKAVLELQAKGETLQAKGETLSAADKRALNARLKAFQESKAPHRAFLDAARGRMRDLYAAVSYDVKQLDAWLAARVWHPLDIDKIGKEAMAKILRVEKPAGEKPVVSKKKTPGVRKRARR